MGTVKLTKVKPAAWAGNGHGTSSAAWVVVCDGVQVGRLMRHAVREWRMSLDGIGSSWHLTRADAVSFAETKLAKGRRR